MPAGPLAVGPLHAGEVPPGGDVAAVAAAGTVLAGVHGGRVEGVMNPYHQDDGLTIYHGDCLDQLKTLPDNSIHAIVTDPPYGLSNHSIEEVADCLQAWINGTPYQPKGKGFMGKAWDAWVPGPEVWKECLRVLKPGGHLLAFAGTRSMDLMSMALRLSGFELRDSIGYAHDGGEAPLMAYCYGSGFPKSCDISKQIDKAAGAERQPTGRAKPGHEGFANRGNLSSVQSLKGTMGGEGGFARPWMDDPEKVEAYHQETAPATDAARQWEGWGSALKPAWEPILLCRKPLDGTLAANTLKHGCGGINVDGSRVGTEVESWPISRAYAPGQKQPGGVQFKEPTGPMPPGRWPANLIHSGEPEVVGLFPETGASKATPRNNGEFKSVAKGRDAAHVTFGHDDTGGSAARFFKCCPDDDKEDHSARRIIYQAKASKKDRDEGCEGMAGGSNRINALRRSEEEKTSTVHRNHHPTVKSTALCRYLVKLVTPPGGTILDPFMGSGSTGKAAVLEGFNFIGIEREAEYAEIAKTRIVHVKSKPAQGELFT